MASIALRTLEETGPSIVLAPERWHAEELDSRADGVTLRELVLERREIIRARDTANAIIVDTTHAKDGVLDLVSAERASRGPAASPKKRVCEGDLLVSRLRPYLRQIALAHPASLESARGHALVCSTEFYVFRPRRPGDDVSFLLPFLLGEHVQRILFAGQEGGHHPRVPRETLLSLRVPRGLVDDREGVGAKIDAALRAL